MSKIFFLSLLLMTLAFASPLCAQELPTAEPKMFVTTDQLHHDEETVYNGNAPMTADFESNIRQLGEYTPFYEWRWMKEGQTTPFLVRYVENTNYTFMESGTYKVSLHVSFVSGTDTIVYDMDEPFVISIAESQLEMPNAFTPNGDGINDVLKVKDGYRSIIDFKAMIFNRWGKKLFEWTDIAKGWDGKSGGHDVPDGAYFLVLKAKGADGKIYNFKKTITLLRGFEEHSQGQMP